MRVFQLKSKKNILHFLVILVLLYNLLLLIKKYIDSFILYIICLFIIFSFIIFYLNFSNFIWFYKSDRYLIKTLFLNFIVFLIDYNNYKSFISNSFNFINFCQNYYPYYHFSIHMESEKKSEKDKK